MSKSHPKKWDFFIGKQKIKNILVIASHPNIEHSYANKIILLNLELSSLNIEICHIDKLYPTYDIDIETEQSKLIKADVVVLQFPFYWYSVPAVLKNWIDKVLSYGFAYGSAGDKLKDKHLVPSITVGGPEESYSSTGYNHFSIKELLRPLEQTAYLTQMIWNEPVYTHGCIYIPNVYNTKEEVESRAKNHANRLIEKLESLS